MPLLSWVPGFIRKRVERAMIYMQKQIVEMLLDGSFTIVKSII